MPTETNPDIERIYCEWDAAVNASRHGFILVECSRIRRPGNRS